MKEEILVVRKVNKNVYRKFRNRALEENKSVGVAITEAMKDWLELGQSRTKLNPRAILKLNGIVKTGKEVAWSTEVDDMLYGGKV
jgi:hypothetical protein